LREYCYWSYCSLDNYQSWNRPYLLSLSSLSLRLDYINTEFESFYKQVRIQTMGYLFRWSFDSPPYLFFFLKENNYGHQNAHIGVGRRFLVYLEKSITVRRCNNNLLTILSISVLYPVRMMSESLEYISLLRALKYEDSSLLFVCIGMLRFLYSNASEMSKKVFVNINNHRLTQKDIRLFIVGLD